MLTVTYISMFAITMLFGPLEAHAEHRAASKRISNPAIGRSGSLGSEKVRLRH